MPRGLCVTLLAFGPKAKNLLQNVNHPVAICTRRKLETFSTFDVSIGLSTLGRPCSHSEWWRGASLDMEQCLL